MTSNNEAKLLDHEADGIREYDNMLPRWWVIKFYLTIVFAVAYLYYYEIGPGPSLISEYEQEKSALEFKLAQNGNRSDPGKQDWKAILVSADLKRKGQVSYSAKCVACHGAQGQGGIGPNLTDDYWIHGNTAEKIAIVIAKGITDKGMPPWEAMMTQDELNGVVAYVKSMQGTNPPGAKAPQGNSQGPKE